MKYTKEILEEAVKQSKCFSDVARFFGKRSDGGSICHIKKVVLSLKIDISHFLTASELSKLRCCGGKNKRTWQEILVNGNKDYRESWLRLRRALIESGVEYKCVKCGITDTWNNLPISLEIDHINGNPLDNTRDNLRFVCPNCHSQTDTYCRPRDNNEDIKVRKNRYKTNKFCECGKQISIKAIRCKSCVTSLRYKDTCKRPTKIVLEQILIERSYNMVQIGKLYGVTDNAVRKWCKFFNIEIPKGGFYSKIKYGGVV